jgi:hypothetical protein
MMMGSMVGEDAVFTFPEDVPAIETEVLVDCGEPGMEVSGEVEQAGVVSAVAEEEVTSRSLTSRSGVSDSGGLGSASALGWVIVAILAGEETDEGFGEAGGVGRSRAC